MADMCLKDGGSRFYQLPFVCIKMRQDELIIYVIYCLNPLGNFWLRQSTELDRTPSPWYNATKVEARHHPCGYHASPGYGHRHDGLARGKCCIVELVE